MSPLLWPHLHSAPGVFYDSSLGPTTALWRSLRIPGAVGSGRPSGPRNWQWSATVVLAVAALEAGLEELVLAGHARRSGVEGSALLRDERRYLVEDPLQAPSAQKIERVVFTAFGARLRDLSPLPNSCTFTARRKPQSHAGSGRGSAAPGPTSWTQLSDWLGVVMFVRHAVAHGDVAKSTTLPSSCAGDLWVEQANGRWSVQQPHALTTLRVVVATYNAVASALAGQFGDPQHSVLRPPDEVFDYAL